MTLIETDELERDDKRRKKLSERQRTSADAKTAASAAASESTPVTSSPPLAATSAPTNVAALTTPESKEDRIRREKEQALLQWRAEGNHALLFYCTDAALICICATSIVL